jgi:DNA-binding SARP family transcriptional activator
MCGSQVNGCRVMQRGSSMRALPFERVEVVRPLPDVDSYAEVAGPELDFPRDVRQSPIFIRLFGGFQLLKHGNPVVIRGRGKSEALLQILALHGSYAVPRDELLERLWPDIDVELAGQSLNSLVYSLHKLLRDALGGVSTIINSDGGYRLNRDEGVGTDIEWFVELGHAGDQQAILGNDRVAVDLYSRAVQLYRGDLQGHDDAEFVIKREHLRARYLTLLARLAQYHFLGEEYSECLDYALRLLDWEPCREDAHRIAMACYVRRGERAQSLRQYRLCESILCSEFGATPEPATTALFAQIRDDPASV